MKTQSPDTHPEAERVQIELLRKAGMAKRISIAGRLSRSAIQLSRQAIRKANPTASETELHLLFIELNYGKELADRLRAHFAQRG